MRVDLTNPGGRCGRHTHSLTIFPHIHRAPATSHQANLWRLLRCVRSTAHACALLMIVATATWWLPSVAVVTLQFSECLVERAPRNLCVIAVESCCKASSSPSVDMLRLCHGKWQGTAALEQQLPPRNL